jgi:hypothetical protein
MTPVGICLAGTDTTGHSLAWALYLVSQHPEVEAKVVAELAQHGLLATPGSPNPRPVQWDDLAKLTYLNAVIKVRICVPIATCLVSLPYRLFFHRVVFEAVNRAGILAYFESHAAYTLQVHQQQWLSTLGGNLT